MKPGNDLAGQPQHQGVDQQQCEAEREDYGRERQQNHQRAHSEVDYAQNQAGENECAELAAVGDRADDGRGDQ